jgi:rhodanese-related sulfurtransferase
VSSTIGFEHSHNALLKVRDAAVFVRETTSKLGPQPPNFERIVALNRGPLVADEVHVDALGSGQVQAEQRGGALLVDVRTDVEFDHAHIPGAVCNPTVRAGFGTKLAWVIDRDQAVVLIGRSDSDAVRAAHFAAAVGVDKIAGFLAGGMTSWHEEKRHTVALERIDVPALHARVDGELQILDVRERDEWEDGHLPGAVHMPYHDIDAVPAGIDPARSVAVICSSGQRSAVASSLLQLHGLQRVIHVADGGVGTWSSHGWPLESAEIARAVSF